MTIHIAFNGECQRAFEFYAKHLDAEIGHLLKVKDSPISNSFPTDWQNKIIHADINIRGVRIAGGDVQVSDYAAPEGIFLLLSFESAEEVRNTFDLLVEGGRVVMEPQTTFWSVCYAIVVDKFGVPWKLNCVSS